MNKLKVIFISLFAVLFLMTGTAQAALSWEAITGTVWGNKRVAMATVTFDSSYASGGESVSLRDAGIRLGDVEHALIQSTNRNYSFEYDYENDKIKVFAPAPAIVWEEKHTTGTGVTGFTLDYPAAYVVAVVNSGGTAYPLIYSGSTTLGTATSCLSAPIQDGVRTGISVAATSGDFVVTYATQAWQDLYALLVQNELLTGTGVTRHTISGNTIFGYMCGTFGGSGVPLNVIEWTDTAGALEIGVDFGDYANGHSGATQAVCLIPTGTKATYITYLKHPGDTGNDNWLMDRYVRDENAASGTSIHALDQPLLLWLQGQYVTMTGDPPHLIVLEDQPVFFNRVYGSYLGGSLGTDNSGCSEVLIRWNYRAKVPVVDVPSLSDHQVWLSVDEANGTDLTHATYLYGHPWEIPNLVPLEVTNGTDLSNITATVLMIGR